jgi:mRNA interferase MazF
VKRGEVWIAQLPQEIKSRPVLILSRDSMSPRRLDITVAYLTSNVRASRAEVLLTPAADGVSTVCVVNLDSINTIPKKWLVTYRCTMSPARMLQVAGAIRFALNLP